MFSSNIVLKLFASREAAEFKHLDLNDQQHWQLNVLSLDPTWKWNLRAKLKENEAYFNFQTIFNWWKVWNYEEEERKKSKQLVNK